MSIDIKEIRKDFPILSTQNRGKPLIYLDNAASSQKPHCVIDALSKYYSFQNSNVHREFTIWLRVPKMSTKMRA